jgi:glycosyltransferase involved in cell wall biosynthesis
VIHLGTRTNIFKPNKKEKKYAILSIAAQKAQRTDFLIQSIEKLLKTRKDFELWVVGSSGEHDKELKKITMNLKLTEKIKFFGKVSDKELVELYSQSLAVIHLVRQPPFGMIVTEAMSCGTPVIGCKPGGIEEIVEHNETGYLINEDDSEMLVKYVEKILDDPLLSKSMGIKGRKRVQKYFEMNEKNFEFRELMLNWINSKS